MSWYRRLTNIALKLTPAQEAWIETAVARGDFAPPPDEALSSIIDTGIVAFETLPDNDLYDDELAYVRAKLAEAEESVTKSKTLTLEELRQRMATGRSRER